MPTKPKTTSPELTTPAIVARMILAPQSAGRIGKSTTAEALLEWLEFAEISAVVLDLDAEHKTLSNRYPEISTILPAAATTDDGWQRLLLALDPPPSDSILVDMPAQATDHLLVQLVERGSLETLTRCGIRLTCLIFPVEDSAAKQSAVRCIRTLGDRVDYLCVVQPGPKELIENFEDSVLGKLLDEQGAKQLRLPRISRPTLETYERAVKKEGRWLSFAEAGKHLPTAAATELEIWRNAALSGCEAVSEYLVADSSRINRRVEREQVPVKLADKQEMDF